MQERRGFEVNDRVRGVYLRQPFAGRVKDIDFDSGLPGVRRYLIVFDAPVDVARPPLSNRRTRANLLLGPDGESVDAKGRKDGLAKVSLESESA